MESRPKRRRRPAISCVECRRRKVKCDRVYPCKHCLSAGSSCAYEDHNNQPNIQRESQWPDAQRAWSSPSARTSPTTAQPSRVSPILTSSEGFNGRPVLKPVKTALVNKQISTPQTSNNSDPLPTAQEPQRTLDNLLKRVEELENISKNSSPRQQIEAEDNSLRDHSGLVGSHIKLNKTRILGASHWKTNTRELAPVMNCYLQAVGDNRASFTEDVETKAMVSEMGDLLRTAKDITRHIKTTRPSGSFADPGFGLMGPTREVADQMANLYFQSFESAHRILHVPSFWADYRRYWDQPQSVTTSLRLKVLLVVGIGSSLFNERNPDTDIRIMVHQWVQEAQIWLSGPLKKDRLDLTAIQIYCLTILARQIFSIGGDLIWMSMGSLVHRAMQIGLHRDPKYLPPMSLLQAEVRRRLWATILELFIQASLDAAMPPRISLEEFDTEPPTNMNDEDLNETTTEIRKHSRDIFTGSTIQLLLLDSFPTRLRVLQFLYGLQSDIDYLDVITLTSKIMESCRASDAMLSKNEGRRTTMFHRYLLDFLVRRFVLNLHVPFAVKARANPLFYFSLRTTIDVSMAIISPAIDERWNQLMTIGGGMFREGFRCAGSVISFELIAEVEAQQRDSTLHHSSLYIISLKTALANMIDFSEERIRLGETNIKSPMFLSQILAYVKTIETGSPSELKIAQSGRDSLKLGVELLQNRVNALPFPFSNALELSQDDVIEHGDHTLDLDLDFFLGDADYS